MCGSRKYENLYLLIILQEIENLTLDLEACQQQLQSKYGAVKIIQKLSRLEQARQKQYSRKALEASKKLEQVRSREFATFGWHDRGLPRGRLVCLCHLFTSLSVACLVWGKCQCCPKEK